MTPTHLIEHARQVDPIETVEATIHDAWEALCQAYEVNACGPDFQYLLRGVDLSNAEQAAQELVASMLLDIMENVGRFSPWYRMPARAFGVFSVREATTNQIHWLLAPEARQKWSALLGNLSNLLERYNGLIRAMVMVDSLMDAAPEDPCMAATCACDPPRVIYMRKSVLDQVTIICDSCQQTYSR
jgi:hypothetical protein